ncbi:MAG: hypothetical protein ACI4XH_00575 [Acutalibacteraceae bacterium]
MKEWLINNWQFLVKEAIVPIITFVIGIFSGITIERKSQKNKSKIKGNGNISIQDIEVNYKNKE